MPVRGAVHRSVYLDSVALLRVAERLRALPGVREAAVLMGTSANHELARAAGLGTPETAGAGPGDLLLVVEAESQAFAAAALAAAERLVDAREQVRPRARLPRTLESARRQLPDANLASISVPGAYAATEARRALGLGLHVFLFSGDVPIEDEVRLKRMAIGRGLLCMGPDCGTAYVNGVGLGFANVVRRGRIGVVAASGTGLQAVACYLDRLGEGVSQGIGVGGRDLSDPVGGLMTVAALEALARDPATAVVVLVSKPPAPPALPRLVTALARLGKPAVVSCLGAPPRPEGPGRWVETLEDAATAAAAIAQDRAWRPGDFSDPGPAGSTGIASIASAASRGPGLLGLYAGGTLAHEARLVLEPLLGAITSNLSSDRPGPPSLHEILDLGADELIAGRPHPMLDPEGRAARIREAGRRSSVGGVLLDLVLGRGTHPDPAPILAAAIEAARLAAASEGRALDVIVAVIGTDRDPQGLERQIARLAKAGAHVASSNAGAARLAARLLLSGPMASCPGRPPCSPGASE